MTTQPTTQASHEDRSGLFYAVVVAFYLVALVSLPLLLSVSGCAAGG